MVKIERRSAVYDAFEVFGKVNGGSWLNLSFQPALEVPTVFAGSFVVSTESVTMVRDHPTLTSPPPSPLGPFGPAPTLPLSFPPTLNVSLVFETIVVGEMSSTRPLIEPFGPPLRETSADVESLNHTQVKASLQ